MRLYHFLPTRFALLALGMHRIKVARFADLNDPFELFALELSERKHRSSLRALKGEIHNRFGLVCFSKRWSNPVLWSHYADKHKGVCLGFDVPDYQVQQVTYTPERLAFEFEEESTIPRVKAEAIEALLNTKFKDWAYEEEYRIFVSLDPTSAEDGLYFLSFGEMLRLREVVIGPSCPLPYPKVKSLVSSYNDEVEVVKARLAFETFSIAPDKRYLGT